jgi:hypothetical protein
MRLLRRIISARYIDAAVIGVLQDVTDAIRTLGRQLGAPPPRKAGRPGQRDLLRHWHWRASGLNRPA